MTQRDDRLAQLTRLVEPQPAPIRSERSVELWPLVSCQLHNAGFRDLALLGSLRDAFGRAKYGVPLSTWNGRAFLVDALQEGLDAIVYLSGELAERQERGDMAGAQAVGAALGAQTMSTAAVLDLLLDGSDGVPT